MKFINIGKIVNTHGIKGELRILSDFKYKDKVFKKDFKFYIGKDKEELIVNTYRHHKIFDMVTFNDLNDINLVLKYKGKEVYINEEDLDLDGEIYIDNLIGYKVVVGDKDIGVVTDVMHMKANDILRVNDILIPYVKEFILKIEDNTIYVKDVGGLI
ncbi:MAG: 16S rRNA processing protein RimM [Bacilli bacterium]|jgi:16S rRNA processing protein RimM|nr:16S rRNA processing protein RimM [Bacilli bacterium]